MNYLGVSCGYHDAAVSVIDSEGEIRFAAHSERYSKIKNDPNLSVELLNDALRYIDSPVTVCYYENPYKKFFRQIRSGEPFSLKSLAWKTFIDPDIANSLGIVDYKFFDHHLSHAAAGFQTSPFEDATVIVVDAIGEFKTVSIISAGYNDQGHAEYRTLWSQSYPHSLGLFYTALTAKVGLRPLEDEYVLMGMSAYGTNKCHSDLRNLVIADIEQIKFKQNLHLGLDSDILTDTDPNDIAYAAQNILEELLESILKKSRRLGRSRNLVFMGGVALNCLANRFLGKYYNSIWIMPNPGDAGSSLGAAALAYQKHVNWKNAFLGFNIDKEYPVQQLYNTLITNKIVGVANGRAEYGPRALGNRSLLADPRDSCIKDKVNQVKQRQKFRPFAPIILEEYANDYFIMSNKWLSHEYMQTVSLCKDPIKFSSICHVDGTSRVQTVPNNNSGIRKLLELWHATTGCPMLLNTSLNIRGQPMVNDENDAEKFSTLYQIPVY